MTLYATVTAINSVGLSTFQFSNMITVDSSPPIPGVVVELSQDYIFDDTGKIRENANTCLNPSGIHHIITIYTLNHILGKYLNIQCKHA